MYKLMTIFNHLNNQNSVDFDHIFQQAQLLSKFNGHFSQIFFLFLTIINN